MRFRLCNYKKSLVKTLFKVKTTKQPFDNIVVKELLIPQFVDKYNYNINYVD